MVVQVECFLGLFVEISDRSEISVLAFLCSLLFYSLRPEDGVYTSYNCQNIQFFEKPSVELMSVILLHNYGVYEVNPTSIYKIKPFTSCGIPQAPLFVESR